MIPTCPQEAIQNEQHLPERIKRILLFKLFDISMCITLAERYIVDDAPFDFVFSKLKEIEDIAREANMAGHIEWGIETRKEQDNGENF